MQRENSSISLQLLDPDLDNSDVFDPPAWIPGRFLQFVDISLEDEHSVRPVSLTAERTLHDPWDSVDEMTLPSSTELRSTSYVTQMDGEQLSQSHRYPKLTRPRLAMVLTSCMTVALTALTLLNFL